MASSPKKKLYLRLFMIPIRHKNASYYIAYTFLIALCILISTVIMIDQHETLKYYLDFYSTKEPTMSAKKGGMRNSSAGSNAFIKAVSILGERNSGTTWIYEWVYSPSILFYFRAVTNHLIGTWTYASIILYQWNEDWPGTSIGFRMKMLILEVLWMKKTLSWLPCFAIRLNGWKRWGKGWVHLPN